MAGAKSHAHLGLALLIRVFHVLRSTRGAFHDQCVIQEMVSYSGRTLLSPWFQIAPWQWPRRSARVGVNSEVRDESQVWRLPTAGVSPTVDVDYLAGYLPGSR